MKFLRGTLATILVVAAAPLAAQAPQSSTNARFTLDDVLDVRNVNVGDLSGDGRWLVVTTASLRDRLGTDNSRFGDPTYVAPSAAEVTVIDTRSGESRKVFPVKRQARGFAWSPDGSQLAFLLYEGEAFRLVLWERERGRLRTVQLAPNRLVAENAPLQWTADGGKLLFSVRTADWGRNARERFLREVSAPIVVQSSEDPFLSWEEIRRRSSVQIPAVYHAGTGRVEELLPETALGAFALTADGQLLRYEEDITTKTDYTLIFGRETKVLAQPAAGGEAKTLLPSTKDIRLVWSGDGRAYTYSKDGKLFFATVEGGEAKKLAGEDAPKAGEEPADSAARAADKERRDKERFTPVRLSQTGPRARKTARRPATRSSPGARTAMTST